MVVFAWVGLVASWLALLLVVKLVIVVLRVLKDIRTLAEMTRDTAVRLADNIADVDDFAALEVLAARLPPAVRALPRRTRRGGPRLSSVSPGLGGRSS